MNPNENENANSGGWPAFCGGAGPATPPSGTLQAALAAANALSSANSSRFGMMGGLTSANSGFSMMGGLASANSGGFGVMGGMQPSSLFPRYNLMQPQIMNHMINQQQACSSNQPSTFNQPSTSSGKSESVKPWSTSCGDSLNDDAEEECGELFKVVPDECALCCEIQETMFMFVDCKHYPYCQNCMKSSSYEKFGVITCPHCTNAVSRVEQVRRLKRIAAPNKKD